MSRPSSSWPMRCSRLGGANFPARSCCRGSYGAIRGAKTAIRIKMLRTAVPKSARRLLKKTRRKSCRRLRVSTPGAATASCWIWASATLVPHPRVEDRVEDIHDEVDQHEEHGPVEDDALDHCVVPTIDGVVGDLAHPRPAEDLLGDQCPAHEEPNLQPDDRH